jgi:hypothetical protein
MAYKVNYGLERAERNRAKQAKKEAKLAERKAAATVPVKDTESGGLATPDGETEESK